MKVLDPPDLADAIGRAVWRIAMCRTSLPFYRLRDGWCCVATGAHTQLLYTPEYGSAQCHRLAGHQESCRWVLSDGQTIEREAPRGWNSTWMAPVIPERPRE